MRKEFSW